MNISPATATIIGSLISGVVALVVSAFQNNKSMALVEYKIAELKKQVEKHNKLVERMTTVENKSEANFQKYDEMKAEVEKLKERIR